VGLASALQLWYNDTATTACFNISNTDEGQVDDQAWDYQSCTEMVLPIGSNAKSDFFPVAPYDPAQMAAYCNKKWGVVPRVGWVAAYYGAANVAGSSNIVWSQGALDPWRGLGLQQTPPAGSPYDVIRIDHGAHHLGTMMAMPIIWIDADDGGRSAIGESGGSAVGD
jgi:hypothetical protein